jgi:heme A synthase
MMNYSMKLNRFAAFAWGVVAYNLLVIVWGAYVRASGAGAGCGSHWPLCNGEIIPQSKGIETLVELTHRVTSGISLLLIVGLAVWAFRAFQKRDPVRTGAALSLIFILTEALIGAVLVRRELVAGNASLSRAVVMSIHLINTFALLACLTLTAWWASGGQSIRLRGQGLMAWLLSLALVGTLVLAVSGAVAALGDTLFPATSLAAGVRDDFSQTAHFLIRLRLLHPALALTAGITSFLRPGRQVRGFMLAVTALVVVQLAAGLLNVALLAPIWLQLVHLLLADLLWLALVLLAASALAQPLALKNVEELSLRPELTV